MESLLEASDYIHMVEERQGILVSAPEESAYRYEWIDEKSLLCVAGLYGKSTYG
jgi:glucose-1-phosphate thymidylyltransferase